MECLTLRCRRSHLVPQPPQDVKLPECAKSCLVRLDVDRRVNKSGNDFPCLLVARRTRYGRIFVQLAFVVDGPRLRQPRPSAFDIPVGTQSGIDQPVQNGVVKLSPPLPSNFSCVISDASPS